MNVNIDSNEYISFGHFDKILFNRANTADQTLDILYNGSISNKSNATSDITPLVLFSYNDKKIQESKKFIAVSFMQFNEPQKCKSIKQLYKYSESCINKVIDTLRDKKLIENVDAKLYIPFSFMNIAVAFYSNSLTDICTVIKNILYNNLAKHQYSVLSTCDLDTSIRQDKGINISLRFIWKPNIQMNKAFDCLEKALSNIEDYSINHLLGNNDCLLQINNSGYDIIDLIAKPHDSFKTFLNFVENTRVTISFPKKDIPFVNLKLKNKIHSLLHELDLNLSQKQTVLIENLNSLRDASPEFQKNDINDVIYRVTEFNKFMNVLKKHSEKGIANQLYFSMKKPYNLFLDISIDRLSEVTLDNSSELLETISKVLNDMSSYFGNIFHCNLGFFEERGFYNNIIGLASNVELAYNKYADCICDVLMSDKERFVDKLQVSSSVTADKEPMICTSEIFEHNEDISVFNRLLINVNIPVFYVFKFQFVSRIIIHEVAHYVGDRKRKERADAMCKVFSSIIADPIYQRFKLFLTVDASKKEKILLKQFEESDNHKKIYAAMKNEVSSIINEHISKYVDNICNASYYMNSVINAIIDAINDLPNNLQLISELSDVIVEYQFWYYEYFEDFYLKKFPADISTINIMQELSEYSIKDYNKRFVSFNISKIFKELINNNQQGSEIANTTETSCYIYTPVLSDLIPAFSNAVMEAYCDIMMIKLSGMNFNDYMNLMSGYKELHSIIADNDYLTWMRLNFVADFLGKEKLLRIDLPERFKYFKDVGIFDIMHLYFDSLSIEIKAALSRMMSSDLLSGYLKSMSSFNEEKHINAIYDMFFSINS